MLRELKLIAKNRNIQGYKIMSSDKLLSILNTRKKRKKKKKEKKYF